MATGADPRRDPRALVAGHGDFAAGVVSAVAQITGRGEVFVALTNRGLGADEIERLMREHVDATGARVIFTDLPAGSCTIAARRLLRARPELVLVTGANVAALLDFVFHADVPEGEAARRAAEKGRAGLTATGRQRWGIELHRIDDRLIHGQVVVGWGQPLSLGFIVLVDDEVAGSDWEQELYRMGVPPEMDVHFESVESGIANYASYAHDARPGLMLTGDIATMARLVAGTAGVIRAVNPGGIHYRANRVQRLRYVFLSDEEQQALRALAGRGVEITAQDVPSARAIALEDVLSARGDA